MIKRIIHFIKYNNAFSIGFALIFLSFSGALAASPEGRQAVADAVYSAKETVQSIDNSYIINLDFNSYSPKAQITSVTEDENHYYVDYKLFTVDLADHVWQQVEKTDTLKVAKNDLGKRDLGSYVTTELNQVVSRQASLLKETQDIEKRNGVTNKVVVTAYSGLVGKLLDGSEEVIPSYEPVQSSVAGNSDVSQVATPSVVNIQSETTNTPPANFVVSGGDDTTPPNIAILGNNPARLEVRDVYVDLGVYVTDNKSDNIGHTVSLDGQVVKQVSIDMSKEGEHEITYSAKDQAGNITTVSRKVIVTDPYKKTQIIEPEAQTVASSTAPKGGSQ